MQAVSANSSAAPTLAELLRVLLAARDLTRPRAAQLVNAMLAPETPDAQIAAALALLTAKGENPEELAGFADALYQRVRSVAIPPEVLDTAGTGASAVKTFNVSTAAAFVIAAAGCQIAKHGARASTSRSGSADVLTVLGVRIDCESRIAVQCLRELGICFLFAPSYHPALARVAPIRKALGFRTAFNLVGPMVNPCRAQYRLLGVSDQARMADVAGALSLIGVSRAWVLRGGDGLDEITTASATRVLEVREGRHNELLSVSPADFGLIQRPTEAARADSVGRQCGDRARRALRPRSRGPGSRCVQCRARPRRSQCRRRSARPHRRWIARLCRSRPTRNRRRLRAAQTRSPDCHVARRGFGARRRSRTVSAEFLQRVMDAKRIEMSLLGDPVRESVRDAALAARLGRNPRFRDALLAHTTAIIAEFKRHSPSAGDIQARSRSRRGRPHL